MQAKYTPGPWQCSESVQNWGATFPRTFEITGGDSGRWIAQVLDDQELDRGITNAKLIAAAPDMFEALNGLTLLITTLRDCQLGGSEVAAWIIEKPVYAQAISALQKAGL